MACITLYGTVKLSSDMKLKKTKERSSENEEKKTLTNNEEKQEDELGVGESDVKSDVDVGIKATTSGKRSKKVKGKRKSFRKRVRKATWKALKKSWTYLQAGLVQGSQSAVSLSFTGAVQSAMQTYQRRK